MLTIPVLKKIDFNEKYGPYSGATSTHKGCLKRRFACEALNVDGTFDFEVLAGTLTAYCGAAMLPDHPPIAHAALLQATQPNLLCSHLTVSWTLPSALSIVCLSSPPLHTHTFVHEKA